MVASRLGGSAPGPRIGARASFDSPAEDKPSGQGSRTPRQLITATGTDPLPELRIAGSSPAVAAARTDADATPDRRRGRRMHLQARLARRPQAGRDGEATAVRHLIGLGYRILARNLRFRSGEIDIIAQDRDTVVFVEVRSRGSERHGSPLESIGWRKQVRVIRCAKLWLQRECLTDRVPCRFDVIGVTVPPGRPAARVLRHIRNAFEARE